MNSIIEILGQYHIKKIDKPTFIERMYDEHHSHLFDYANYLKKTNIKRIEIEDGNVIMTSRDRGIRIACLEKDYRIAPIEILNFFDYEKDESKMIEKLTSDGDVFFDIGANIGWYSINTALAQRATKVFSFEPIPKTYNSLKKNLELNSVENVIAHNFGFSNNKGEFTFYYYPEGSGNASSANVTDRQNIETVRCSVRTLDDYVAETGLYVDFIKCDVEGAELLVFQGGENTIKRDLPIIFTEILRKWSAKFHYNPNDIFEFFRRMGYAAFTVNKDKLIDFGNMDQSTVETNFFFLHAEKHEIIIKRFS